MMRKALLIGVGVGLAATAVLASGAPGGAERPAIYATACASCHGVTLQGGAGPLLKGGVFVAKWTGEPQTALHAVIAEQMPLGHAGTLTDEQAAQLTAYIMAENGLSTRADGKMAAALNPFAPMGADEAALAKNYPVPPKTVEAATTRLPSQAELLDPADSDWPLYNRDYRGRRFSPLRQITEANAGRLTVRCLFQTGESGSFQASPLIYRGTLFVTTPYSTYAINAANCRKLWEHSHAPTGAEGGPNSRGPSLYEGKIIRGTPDGWVLALDAATGKLLWETQVLNSGGRTALSAAVTVVDGRAFIGVAGGDRGGKGRIFAFDASSGKLLWTFNAVPNDGEPGAETWGGGQHVGGGGTWSTISYDPTARKILVPIGNPGSDLDGRMRPGANLYTNSVVALDPDSGKLAWYVQQIAHDVHDWNTAAAPMLYELNGRGYMAVATKAGWLFTYDAKTRALLSKEEISRHENVDVAPSETPTHICPGTLGGAEWNGPAFDAANAAVLVNSVDWCGTFKRQEADKPNTFGGGLTFDPEESAKGWLRAFDAVTGKQRWAYQSNSPMIAGVTPTAGGVTFTGSADGDFLVFGSKSGKLLFKFFTGGSIGGGVSTYEAGGQQLVAVASGNASRTIWRTKGAATIVVFNLPQQATPPAAPKAVAKCKDAKGKPAECGTVYARPA